MKFLSWTGLQYFYSKYIGNLNEQLKNVKESIGNLGNLATASKENLVYAINEIKGALSSFVEKKDIVDNLTSQAGDAPLSANMGRELSEDMSVETEWKIYKENNISMTGGCLPMLIQMPILIGLYQVIQKPLSYLAGVDWANASVINEVIRLKDAMVNLGYNIGNLANATMEQLANNSQIQLSKWAGIVGTQGTALEGVSGGVHPWVLNFNFLGLDLSNAPSAAFGHIMALDFSNMSVILLLLIPVLAVIASVISMKVTQAQTGQAAQMTKSMNLMMPVMTAFFTVTLPAGLGLYWIISSVVQILQQLILNAFLDKKGEEIVVTVPEKKQQHRKKRKK